MLMRASSAASFNSAFLFLTCLFLRPLVGTATVLLLLLAVGCSGTSNGNVQPPPQSFTITSSQSSQTVLQAGSGSSITITVVPANGFSGSVSLSASGLPAGVTANFNPATTTSTSALTLSAANNASVGSATITITGTSGGDSARTPIQLTIGGFSVSVVPATLALQQVSTGNTTVTVSEANFSGGVSLTAPGLPAGVAVTFNPATTSSTSTMNLTVNGSVAPGTYSVSIDGTSGSLTQTTALTLTVRMAPPPGSVPASFFALSDVDPADDPTVDGMSYGAVGHPIRLAWPYIETSRGVFDFSLYDQYAAIAPKEGPGGSVAVMNLTLGMTPGWAVADQSTCRTLNGGVIGCQAPPDNLQDWKDFIIALVQHYDGSTLARPHIKYYEIWNEWNVQDPQNGFWMGTPVQLATLQSTACAIIHASAGDQFSLVLTPSTVGDAATPNSQAPMDLARYFSYGGTNCPGGPSNLIDGVSFHGNLGLMSLNPYPLPGEGCTQAGCNGSIVEITNSYRQILNQNLLQATPLLDTEGGFESADIADIDQRAAWLAQFYILQGGLFNSDQLQWVSWFTWGWASSPGVPGQIETVNHTPDPAGVAYNQVFDWLFARLPSAPCVQSGTVWTCGLTGSSGYQAVITWDDSQTCNNGTCTSILITAPSWAVKMRDLAGKSTAITGGVQVSVGLKPIILESQ